MSGPLEAEAAPAPWVKFNRPAPGSRLRLLCFHHAGGGASYYRDWPAALGPRGVEVWPVQLPGREGRFTEPFAKDLDQLAAELADVLGPRAARRPYALYGHSAGAHVAVAFAMEMAARGLPEPVRLFAGAARPPSHPDPDFPLHLMDDAALLAKLKSYGGMPRELLMAPELIEMAVAAARADLQLTETAHRPPMPWLSCPVTAVSGRQDAAVPVELLPHWQGATTGPADVHLLDGGHFPRFWAGDAFAEVVADAG